MADKLSKYLGLPPIKDDVEDADIVMDSPKETPTSKALSKNLSANLPKQEVVKEPREELRDDFTYARENMYAIIEKGSNALEELVDVAVQSQHPRAYEVVATTIKALIDANKELVELSKKKNERETEAKNDSATNVTNNNLFVGTTHDLLKVLSDMNNDKGK